jgi:hypothetical protein
MGVAIIIPLYIRLLTFDLLIASVFLKRFLNFRFLSSPFCVCHWEFREQRYLLNVLLMGNGMPLLK